jgi:hypothetical protein
MFIPLRLAYEIYTSSFEQSAVVTINDADNNRTCLGVQEMFTTLFALFHQFGFSRHIFLEKTIEQIQAYHSVVAALIHAENEQAGRHEAISIILRLCIREYKSYVAKSQF